MGGPRHDRNLQHDTVAGEDLRQRRDRAGGVLPERRALRSVVSGQKGQVPGAAWRHAAENLSEQRCADLRARRLTLREQPRYTYSISDVPERLSPGSPEPSSMEKLVERESATHN